MPFSGELPKVTLSDLILTRVPLTESGAVSESPQRTYTGSYMTIQVTSSGVSHSGVSSSRGVSHSGVS